VLVLLLHYWRAVLFLLPGKRTRKPNLAVPELVVRRAAVRKKRAVQRATAVNRPSLVFVRPAFASIVKLTDAPRLTIRSRHRHRKMLVLVTRVIAWFAAMTAIANAKMVRHAIAVALVLAAEASKRPLRHCFCYRHGQA